MTVAELKKKCDAMIADGYSDSEIILSNGLADSEEDYCTLDSGFSSVVYNPYFLTELIKDWDLDPDNCVVLN